MTLADDAPSRSSEGFEGGAGSLGLADLLQLNAQERFSGCFRIEYEQQLGVIFFRDGEIVHAERGELFGEEAFREVLGWPRGRFSAEPNVVAARRTITKSCEQLLLDALRHAAARPQPGPDTAARPPAASPLEVVRRMPGVAQVALISNEGKRLGAGGYEADVLAGQAAYLAALANELGAALQIGALRVAAVEGEKRHLLLLTAKAQSLAVFVRAEEELGAVDAAIRVALAKGR